MRSPAAIAGTGAAVALAVLFSLSDRLVPHIAFRDAGSIPLALSLLALCAVPLWRLYPGRHAEGGLLAVWLIVAVYFGTWALFAADYVRLQLPSQLPVIGAVGLFGGLLASVLVADGGKPAYRMILALAAVHAVLTLGLYMTGAPQFISGSLPRATGVFRNPYGLFTLLACAIPMAVAALWEKKPSFILGLGLTVMILALILTFFRGLVVAVSVGAVFASFRLGGWMRAGGAALIALVACGVVAGVRSNDQVSAISSRKSAMSRGILAEQGWAQARANWILGAGIGNLKFSYALPPSDPLGALDENTVNTPKNLYLQVIGESGILGISFLLAMGWAAYRLAAGGTGDSARVGLAAAWVAVATSGFFDAAFGIMSWPLSNFTFGLLVGSTLRRLAVSADLPATG